MNLVGTNLTEISEPKAQNAGAAQVQFGKLIPPQQQILLYSPDDWEEFTREWVHSQKNAYTEVLRMSGANDMGVDVAGLTDLKRFKGVWDNFQCKHYAEALTPGTALVEVAKILWHSFSGHYKSPRKYYFVAPRGCGMSLTKLLADHEALKKKTIVEWNKYCAEKITSTGVIKLEGKFKSYVDDFDFSIFTHKTTLEIIDEHRLTPYYSIRFGGGLSVRPPVSAPPQAHQGNESKYIQQLYQVYEEKVGGIVKEQGHLEPHPELAEHFNRQREFFYHAEALRNFARDTVPPGTYEDLQSEVHAGVIDIQESEHSNSYSRLTSVLQGASSLQLTANALISVVKVQDRKGICHQLANEDRLRWKKT